MAASMQKHAAPMNLSKRKVNALDDAPLGNDDMNLFVDAPADSDDEDSDSSDSGASSEFSDLEEEEDDSEDEKVLYDESESENEKVATTSEESPVHTPTLMKETSKILVTKNERSKNLENLRRSGNAKKLAKKKGSKPKDGGVDSGNENSGTAGQANSQDDTPNVYPDTPNVYPDTPNVYPDTPNVYPDEYDFDSSDEEDIRNTVGNIPMEWYRDYGHIGYDWEGRKILAQKKGDELDKFLDKMENPDYWRTVKDKSTGQSVLLSEQDIDTIHRIKSGAYPDSSTDPYAPWVDFFSYDTMIHPVSNRPEHKRSFTPSNLERLKVGRMVHAIKMGWMKPRVEKDEDEDEEDELPKYYQLWDEENESEMNKRFRHHIPAPKAALPGHAESYNPPPEYLMTDAEKEAWENQDPVKRRIGFIPQSFSSLRLVPAYRDFIKERFERCLDLYLCPRQRKMRANVNAEDLIPKLPKPRDLQPFPTTQALVYKGHTNLVRTISIDPTGQWFASGSDDATVRFWEITSGRCLKTVHVPGAVKSLAWNPNPGVCIVAVAVENTVFMLNPHLADKVISAATDAMLNLKETEEAEVKNLAQWQTIEGAYYEAGFRMKLVHAKPVSQVTWHGKGDYLATIAPDQQTMSVLIHQLTKQRSQNPFKKSKGLVQKVCFHPTRPFFYVATQRYVRVYNLVKQELIKKLITNCKWVSSMAIHPGGDNVVIGSYDCRLSWFDLDLSTKPYQTLRHHKRAIRQVAFHRKYPLFCSAADDATTIVCHGRVYDDLMQNPLIVPVKVLHGHSVHRDLGVLDCTFHPTQPWLLSAGADATIRLFT